MTRPLHRNARASRPLPQASLLEIEAAVSDVLDAMENAQNETDALDPIWQMAEAVKGLAWAIGSLAIHHENAAVERVTGTRGGEA